MINDLPHKNLNLHKSPSEMFFGDRQQQMCILFSMWEEHPWTWRQKGWNILLKAWNLIKQRGRREESERSSKQLRSQRSVGLRVSADHARWEGSMGVILRSQGDREEVEKNKRITLPEYMCVCVQMCMHSVKCAKLSKLLKSKKRHQHWRQPNLTASEWSE